MAATPYQSDETQPGIDPSALVFVAAKKNLTAVDGHSGRIVWTTEIPGSKWYNSGFMTIAADPLGVYACRNGTVTCVDPMTGQILWSLKPPGAGSALPVVATMMAGFDIGQGTQVAAAAAAAQAAAASAASG
jgi:outer membrane protein assembly factor BamB